MVSILFEIKLSRMREKSFVILKKKPRRKFTTIRCIYRARLDRIKCQPYLNPFALTKRAEFTSARQEQFR